MDAVREEKNKPVFFCLCLCLLLVGEKKEGKSCARLPLYASPRAGNDGREGGRESWATFQCESFFCKARNC